jgi:hypothetical protein
MLRPLLAASLALALAKQDDGGWTEQVTQAWLHRLERGEWPLARFVDDSAGLVVVDYQVDSPRDDFKPHTEGRRLCGEKLAKAIGKLNTEIIDGVRRSDATECHNRPGPPWCRVGVLYEYMTFTYLLFRPGADRKLRLDAVLRLDNLHQKDSQEEELRFVQTELRRLRATDCAGKPATAPDYGRLQF